VVPPKIARAAGRAPQHVLHDHSAVLVSNPVKSAQTDPGGGAQLETVHWLEGLGPPRDAGALHKSFAQQARAARPPTPSGPRQAGMLLVLPKRAHPCAAAAAPARARILRAPGRALMRSSARAPLVVALHSGPVLCTVEQGGTASTCAGGAEKGGAQVRAGAVPRGPPGRPAACCLAASARPAPAGCALSGRARVCLSAAQRGSARRAQAGSGRASPAEAQHCRAVLSLAVLDLFLGCSCKRVA
jgi:hypothetical protein